MSIAFKLNEAARPLSCRC